MAVEVALNHLIGVRFASLEQRLTVCYTYIVFKVVKKRDFVRARTDFDKNFVITNNGVPEGLYISIQGLKLATEDELQNFLAETLSYLGLTGDGRK